MGNEVEVDVFEMLNQHMDKVVDGVGEQIDAAVGITSESATDEVGSLIDNIKKPAATIEDTDEELSFGDMPNGEIRYKKQKEQLAALRAEVEALKSAKTKEDDEDLTSEMDADERDAFLKEKLEREELENLKKKVSGLEEGKILESLKQREDRFWSNYSAAERVKNAPLIEAAIRKHDLIEHVLSGKITLEKVMSMVNPDLAKRVSHVQSSDKVFGKKTKAPARVLTKDPEGFDLGQAVLRNPMATNGQRKQAINVMTQDLAKQFLS